jgi:aldehyde:ferredoxin oxidoreductase
MFSLVAPGIDAFSPDNPLLFLTGLLVGTTVPGAVRLQVATKSPLTGAYAEANAGGRFAAQLKGAGYDALIIEGQASSPVYLHIDNAAVSIRDATQHWGKLVADTDRDLRAEVGQDQAVVAAIGPSGEKRVRVASIVCERTRAAARGGVGAVMGAKNLKGIVVRGTGRVPVADRDRLIALARQMNTLLLNDVRKQNMRTYGTGSGVLANNRQGMLPTHNFRASQFEEAASISGERITEEYLVGTRACPPCPVSCIRQVELTEGSYAPVDKTYGGPEYESLAALGSLCLNSNLESLLKAHEICNSYGLDTISAGVILAWTMECFERGILSESDLDGIEPRWGDPDAELQLLEKIASREGIGDLLAEGVMRASNRIGRGSEALAMHVKGQELAMHEPRARRGLGLSYATSPRGAVHTDTPNDPSFERDNVAPELGMFQAVSRFQMDGKPELIKKGSDANTLLECLGVCSNTLSPFMGPITLTQTVEAVRLATGWDLELPELMQAAERVNTLRRAYLVKQGFSKADDVLPLRFSEPLQGGPADGQQISPKEFESALQKFYALCGWDKAGVPLGSTLKEQGLEWVATELASLGLLRT